MVWWLKRCRARVFCVAPNNRNELGDQALAVMMALPIAAVNGAFMTTRRQFAFLAEANAGRGAVRGLADSLVLRDDLGTEEQQRRRDLQAQQHDDGRRQRPIHDGNLRQRPEIPDEDGGV